MSATSRRSSRTSPRMVTSSGTSTVLSTSSCATVALPPAQWHNGLLCHCGTMEIPDDTNVSRPPVAAERQPSKAWCGNGGAGRTGRCSWWHPDLVLALQQAAGAGSDRTGPRPWPQGGRPAPKRSRARLRRREARRGGNSNDRCGEFHILHHACTYRLSHNLKTPSLVVTVTAQ